MNCDQAQGLFNAYLDGDVSPSLASELAAHRLECPDCRHALALMEVAGHVIASDGAAQDQLGDDFTQRLLACLNEGKAPRRMGRMLNPRLLWITGSGLAAAACVALVVVGMMRPGKRVAGEIAFGEPQAVRATQGDATEGDAGDASLDDATASFVRGVEATWHDRADSAQSLVEFGQMSIMQMLDRFGVEQQASAGEPVVPPSIDAEPANAQPGNAQPGNAQPGNAQSVETPPAEAQQTPPGSASKLDEL